jgi:aspartyl-tRNA(Asn)/glutamyl-tRNA(Gln) amidotransferase subunit A
VVLAEQARARARELAGAAPAGPLYGVPIVVKDLYDIAGVRTTGCCGAYMERPPAATDSTVVARLLAAGAIIVAKTNQHELACGATSQISSFGPVRNPWDVERIPGGSSGGSAVAVATGAVALAMGSDTGGSIREPASMCGVTGLKPTHGAVSLRGAMPMIPAFDTAGPLALSAEDCLLVFRLLAGYDDADLYSREGTPLPRREVAGLRIGLLGNFLDRVHPETRAVTNAAAAVFESQGAELVEVEGPDPDEAWTIWASRWAEVANCYRDIWEDPRISPVMRGLFDLGRAQSGVDLAQAHEVVLKIRREFQRVLREVDVLLAPTSPYPPPRADESEVEVEGGTLDVHAGGAVRLTAPINLAGLPALALPAGFSKAGLPIGVQLIGPEWSEELLGSIGAAYQRETDWHLRRPPGYPEGG